MFGLPKVYDGCLILLVISDSNSISFFFNQCRDPSGNIKLDDTIIDPLDHPELIHAGKVAAFCANARTMFIEATQTFTISGDPTEAALLVFAQKMGFNKSALEHESQKISENTFKWLQNFIKKGHF